MEMILKEFVLKITPKPMTAAQVSTILAGQCIYSLILQVAERRPRHQSSLMELRGKRNHQHLRKRSASSSATRTSLRRSCRRECIPAQRAMVSGGLTGEMLHASWDLDRAGVRQRHCHSTEGYPSMRQRSAAGTSSTRAQHAAGVSEYIPMTRTADWDQEEKDTHEDLRPRRLHRVEYR